MTTKVRSLVLVAVPLAIAACEDIPGFPLSDPYVSSGEQAPRVTAEVTTRVPPPPSIRFGAFSAPEIGDPMMLLGGLALVSSH